VSKPVLALLAIFTFLNSWKSFFWPLVVLRTESKFVLEVGLSYIQDTSVINNGVVMAGATAGAVPMVIFFLLFQRQLLSGMAVSSLRN
jgi:multiple sugar transport system permease protein